MRGDRAAAPARHDRTLDTEDPLVRFLTARLTEDLGRIWLRQATDPDPEHRPGMAAQVAVLDELLIPLRVGRLPDRRELRILLFGYGFHPGYDPAWTDRLLD